eukprot:TRINITY_DN25817_c4_g1_i1.p1 TRINITY_DN25817_c4_g1~~TRINITY_DN25817_c4_g1_i1.p1  ORF type:complete len:103 (+),score=0.47 TRINITY_DN25817_c4_g1_i1:370-678(+)
MCVFGVNMGCQFISQNFFFFLGYFYITHMYALPKGVLHDYVVQIFNNMSNYNSVLGQKQKQKKRFTRVRLCVCLSVNSSVFYFFWFAFFYSHSVTFGQQYRV